MTWNTFLQAIVCFNYFLAFLPISLDFHNLKVIQLPLRPIIESKKSTNNPLKSRITSLTGCVEEPTIGKPILIASNKLQLKTNG